VSFSDFFFDTFSADFASDAIFSFFFSSFSLLRRSSFRSFSFLSFSSLRRFSIFSCLTFSFLSFSALSFSPRSFSFSSFSFSFFSFSSFRSFSTLSFSSLALLSFSCFFLAILSCLSDFSARLPLISFFISLTLDALGLVSCSVVAEHVGYFKHSNFFNFSSPLKILCCGVLPGKSNLVMVSLGLAGCQTSSAQMDTRLAIGSHNSLPSIFIPDLKLPRCPPSSPHLDMNSLTSLDSLDGFNTYISSLPWPTLWYRLIGSQILSLKQICGFKFRILRFSIIELPSCITLTRS